MRTSARKVITVWLVAVLLAVGQATHVRGDEGVSGGGGAILIGSRRELFVDTYLIDAIDGGQLVLHAPHDAGIVIRFDEPWEGRFCGYVTVIASNGDRGEARFRAYYRGLPDVGESHQVTCMAVSEDGIHWVKPTLRRFPGPHGGATNIILGDGSPATHNFAPFLDRRPDISAAVRFKALGGSASSGLIGYGSPDGVRWRKLRDEPVFRDSGWVFDSQNVAFWSESERCYVLYYRKSAEKVRAIARATSGDFIHWSKPAQMVYSDTGTVVPSNHLYTNQTSPYFRAPHIYIATAARFMPGRQVLTDAQAAAIGVHPKYFGDTSDVVMLTTRGGNRYDRTFLDALIRPGIGWQNWVSRTNYPARNIVRTGPREMSLYVNQNYGQRTAHLRRYTWRIDGLASFHASHHGGRLVTKPFSFSGNRLHLNFATSAAGSVRIAIETPDRHPLPGFALPESPELIGNELDRIVHWTGKPNLAALAGRPIRLVFELKDADVYSFQFDHGPSVKTPSKTATGKAADHRADKAHAKADQRAHASARRERRLHGNTVLGNSDVTGAQ